MVKEGSPLEMCTTTWTTAPSSPMTAQLRTLASMRRAPPLAWLVQHRVGPRARIPEDEGMANNVVPISHK